MNNFEDKMKRLDEIACKLESGETAMEESIALFSEGASLIKELNNYLDDAEKRIGDMIAAEEDEV